MTPFDRKYIASQFWNAAHRKAGTEYQTFFEGIMEKAYPGFQRVRPYGKEGDKGNDGYRPTEGIYYQVYAPVNPSEKEGAAAAKFKADFAKLKTSWDKISTIRELQFVYNDRASGLTLKLEEARAELRAANAGIDFQIFTPKHLEKVLLSLPVEEIAALGFDIDSRNALRNALDQLAVLDEELEKESGAFVLRALDTIKEIIASQNDDGLLLEFDLLEARALQKVERVPEARAQFESIRKRYPNDVRPLLHLAEISLNAEDFDRNAQLLAEAERVAPNDHRFRLQNVLRNLRLELPLDPATIDESTFPSDPRLRSNFYRLHAHLLSNNGDQARADSFVEQALRLNPDKFVNHDARIVFLMQGVMNEKEPEGRRVAAQSVLDQIHSVESAFAASGGLSPRSQSLLNLRKISMYLITDDFDAIESTATDALELLLLCYFDQLIDRILAGALHNVVVGPAEFTRLRGYLLKVEKPVSNALAKVLVTQLVHRQALFSDAKTLLAQLNKQNIVEFVEAVERNDHAAVLAFLGDDLQFSVDIALGIKEPPDLRRRIVDALPDDGSVQKDKLYAILHRDAGEIDEAFDILQKLDLHSLSHVECEQLLPIAEQKKAWDVAVILLERLIATERDARARLQAKLKLFTANQQLDRLPEVVRIGKEVLADGDEMQHLDAPSKETLVAHTALALVRRRDADAKGFVREHESLLVSFEGKVGVQAEAYLKSGDAEEALRSVVEGVKLLRHPSPENYGMLFLIFSTIGTMMPELTLDSLDQVVPESFVKLAEQERWFYIGDGEPLDASKVAKTDRNYDRFAGKAAGDIISFGSEYRSGSAGYAVELILPIDRYIRWQSSHHAQKLSAEQRWDAMEIIEVPITSDGIDPKFLIAKFEDEAKKSEPFFELYCTQDAPFAFLALNEGGVAEAVGRLTSEQRGFIKATTGDPQEFEEQKAVAKRLIAGEAFLLDGTSALMLAETGVLGRIVDFLPGLRAPQSVVTLLLNLRDRFEYVPGREGRMGYVKGRIQYFEPDSVQSETTHTNFTRSIELLERHPDRIVAISAASKSTGFMEQKITASLADACILAQKDHTAVMTEDFLYLKANEVETGKPAPAYCSSIALMRTLYEDGKIRFEEYLGYFAHLAAYRVRFLALTTDDLEKAVFGDQRIAVVRPEQLRKLNLSLTLAEDYGVAPRAAFQVVGSFLFRILRDDSLSAEDATRIFAEIMSTFPTKENRRSFGRTLLTLTLKALSADRSRIVVRTRVREKVEAILRFLDTYGTEPLIIPA